MSRKRSRFVNIEAESDEEIESSIVSEEFDNYEIDNEVPIRTKSQLDLVRELEARYIDADDDYEEEEEATLDIKPQTSLLPTVHSPLLFLVRCLNGKEHEICLRLGAKNECDGVFSVVHKEGLRGYLYIEAYRKQDVDDLLIGIRGVYKNRMSVVPLREMVEAISQVKEFVISEYARVRGGKYAGDIVRIGRTYEHTVEIIAVPRINGEHRKFDSREHRGSVVAKDGGFYFNRDFYRDGYLYKTVLKKSLDFDVEPTFADLRALGVTRSFGINDTVAVARGELSSLIGRMVRVDSSTAWVIIDGIEYEIALADLVKHYEVGQEASYKGINGVIVQCKDGQAVLATNGFTEEIHCSVWDLESVCPSKINRNNNNIKENKEGRNKQRFNRENKERILKNKQDIIKMPVIKSKDNITPNATPGYKTPDIYGTH